MATLELKPPINLDIALIIDLTQMEAGPEGFEPTIKPISFECLITL